MDHSIYEEYTGSDGFTGNKEDPDIQDKRFSNGSNFPNMYGRKIYIEKTI